MALTTDEITICNLAISRLGLYPITSSDTTPPEYTESERHFDEVRDSLLAEFDWSFARTHAYLSQAASAWNFPGWDYAYWYPATAGDDSGFSSCLKPLRFHDSANEFTDRGAVEFTMYTCSGERLIGCDLASSDARLIYTQRVTDPLQYTPEFRQTFALALANALAQSLKADPQIRQQVLHDYLIVSKVAQESDANIGTTKKDDSCAFLDDRGYSG